MSDSPTTVVQPCEHGNHPRPDDHHCFWHCVEPIPPDVFIVCLECGHVWTSQALEDAFERALAEVGEPRRLPAEEITFCQECLHDF